MIFAIKMHASAIYGLASAALLSGCGGLSIYKASADPDANPTELRGIPFYMKSPRCTQETSYLQSQIAVNFTLTEILPKGSPKDKIPEIYNSEVITIPDTPETRLKVEKLLPRLKPEKRIDILGNPNSPVGKLGKDISDELLRSTLFPGERIDDPNRKFLPIPTATVKNSWETSMVVDTSKTYYINTHTPPFGSADGKFDFGPDHTLTAASSTVTDESAKTLLGLFPITEKLKVRWGTVANPTMATMTAGAKRATPPNKQKNIDVEVSRVVSEVKTVWLLRKTDSTVCNGAPPLTLSSGQNGTAGVQLVSMTIIPEGGLKPEKAENMEKEEKPADKASKNK